MEKQAFHGHEERIAVVHFIPMGEVSKAVLEDLFSRDHVIKEPVNLWIQFLEIPGALLACLPELLSITPVASQSQAPKLVLWQGSARGMDNDISVLHQQLFVHPQLRESRFDPLAKAKRQLCIRGVKGQHVKEI